MSRVLWMEELDVADIDIEWHKINRTKINEIIKLFNNWQVNKFDDFEREILIARIKSLRRWGETADFADWQFDILTEMEDHIEKVSE